MGGGGGEQRELAEMTGSLEQLIFQGAMCENIPKDNLECT